MTHVHIRVHVYSQVEIYMNMYSVAMIIHKRTNHGPVIKGLIAVYDVHSLALFPGCLRNDAMHNYCQ